MTPSNKNLIHYEASRTWSGRLFALYIARSLRSLSLYRAPLRGLGRERLRIRSTIFPFLYTLHSTLYTACRQVSSPASIVVGPAVSEIAGLSGKPTVPSSGFCREPCRRLWFTASPPIVQLFQKSPASIEGYPAVQVRGALLQTCPSHFDFVFPFPSAISAPWRDKRYPPRPKRTSGRAM
jgi:hypothetical protein